MNPLATEILGRLQDRKTLSDLVASELRGRILSGSLAMGAELNQFALKQELKVSRTVVREALRQLEAAGMIRLTPYHRATVISVTSDDLDDLWEVRAMLERVAAQRAIRRATEPALARLAGLIEAMEEERDGEVWLELDRQFHLIICDMGGNPILHKLLDAVRLPIDRFIKSAAGVRPRMRSANAEHRAILAALCRGETVAVQRLIRQHIEHTRRLLKGRLQRAGQGMPSRPAIARTEVRNSSRSPR